VAQKFRTGFSPTYVGEVWSGTGASGATFTATITGLLADHNYDFNAYCEDQAGHFQERQTTLTR
jgi:hypothetical protein